MDDGVIGPAQRHNRAIGKGHRLRQSLQPRRDPGGMLMGEFARLFQAAARRQCQHHFAAGGMNAQRIAARLRVAAKLDEINLAAELDGEDRGLAGAAGK